MRTTIVREINDKTGSSCRLELLNRSLGVRLELEEVAFERANKHLRYS